MKNLKLRDPNAKTWTDESGMHLDVRPLLAKGVEPFSCIMGCVQQLEAGETLNIHAPFEPKPLIHRFVQMGLGPQVEHPGSDHWIVQIKKSAKE